MTTFLNLGTADMASVQGQLAWWQRNVHTLHDQRLTLVQLDTNSVIGMLRIANIDSVNANCEVGLDILPAVRRQGLAKKSYRTVLSYLFDHKNMNMVYLKVADFNPDALKLYESLGFERTGFYKDYLFRFGKYWDYHLMCLVRAQYRSNFSR